MPRLIFRLFSACLACAAAAPAAAGNFNDLPPGARAAGMGMAYVSVADDPFGMFYNPAGLAQTAFLQTAADFGRSLSPSGVLSRQAFVYTRPLPILPGSTVGTGLSFLDQQDGGEKSSFLLHFSGRKAFPQYYIRRPVRFGANFRVLQVNPPGEKNKIGLGADLGAIMDAGWNIQAGLAVTQLSTDLGVDNPTVALGANYLWRRRFRFAADLRLRPGLAEVYPGAELEFFQGLLHARFGKGFSLDGVRTVALGLGINYSPLFIDLGLNLPTSGLNRPGGGWTLSMNYKFGAPTFQGRFVGDAARTAEDLRFEILELRERKSDLETETRTARTQKEALDSQVRDQEKALLELRGRVRDLDASYDAEKYSREHPPGSETEAAAGVRAAESPVSGEFVPRPAPATGRKKTRAPARSKKEYRFPLRHRVAAGDTLRKIAEKYYGDPSLWERIYERNPRLVDRGLPIEGATLIIPPPGER